VVICDRFADSTRIFQGITRGDLTETVDRLHDLMIGLEPDLTLLVDLDPVSGLARATARKGAEMRFEDMGLAFQDPRARGLSGAGRAARPVPGDRRRPRRKRPWPPMCWRPCGPRLPVNRG
jgi:dTMP kinase